MLRTFRDDKANALTAARELKRNNCNSIVEIRQRARAAKQIMSEHGRTV